MTLRIEYMVTQYPQHDDATATATAAAAAAAATTSCSAG